MENMFKETLKQILERTIKSEGDYLDGNYETLLKIVKNKNDEEITLKSDKVCLLEMSMSELVKFYSYGNEIYIDYAFANLAEFLYESF